MTSDFSSWKIDEVSIRQKQKSILNFHPVLFRHCWYNGKAGEHCVQGNKCRRGLNHDVAESLKLLSYAVVVLVHRPEERNSTDKQATGRMDFPCTIFAERWFYPRKASNFWRQLARAQWIWKDMSLCGLNPLNPGCADPHAPMWQPFQTLHSCTLF